MSTWSSRLRGDFCATPDMKRPHQFEEALALALAGRCCYPPYRPSAVAPTLPYGRRSAGPNGRRPHRSGGGVRCARSGPGVVAPPVLAVLVGAHVTAPGRLVVLHPGRQDRLPRPPDHLETLGDGQVLLQEDSPCGGISVEVVADVATTTLRLAVVDEDPHAPHVVDVALQLHQLPGALAVGVLTPVVVVPPRHGGVEGRAATGCAAERTVAPVRGEAPAHSPRRPALAAERGDPV